MDPILIAVIVVVVAVGAAAFFVLRRGERGLPPGDSPEALPTSRKAAGRDAPETRARGSAGADSASRREAPATPAATHAPQPDDELDGRSDSAPEPDAVAALEAAPAGAVAVPSSAATAEEDLEALKKGLKSTRGGFISRLAKLFGKKREIDPALLDEIEEVLITADIGVKTSEKILVSLREGLERQELTDEDRIWAAIREQALAILAPSRGSMTLTGKPSVILVVGVNGVGKTTTIGKLASRLHDQGKKVILAAGDTFRAAAVLQLEVWGRRVECPVQKGKERADPGSVVFDAIKRAQEEGADVVIADTAGRLHTKVPLMEELKKVGRTVEKALGRPADEVLLVLDSTNGQNAIQQAQMFREALDISGIVLTKLDGTAKGGVILGIVDAHAVPVKFIGIGERVEDLREFEPETFVKALFEKPDDESLAA